jgi:hypothetical protein
MYKTVFVEMFNQHSKKNYEINLRFINTGPHILYTLAW